ncbi:Transcriptional regulator PadR-like family protein [compost metagenome]
MIENRTYSEQVVDAWEETYKKGLLTFWILLAVYRGPKHVRQIKQYIEEEIPTNLTVDEKSLYRSITRFKKMNLLTSDQVPSRNGGPALKVYSLAPPGEQALKLFYARNIETIFLSKEFHNEVKELRNESN